MRSFLTSIAILHLAITTLAELQMPAVHDELTFRDQLPKKNLSLSYPEMVIPSNKEDRLTNKDTFVPILSVPQQWSSLNLRVGKDGKIYYKDKQVTQSSDGSLSVLSPKGTRNLTLESDRGFLYELAWFYLNRGKRWQPKVVNFLHRYLEFRKQKGKEIDTKKNERRSLTPKVIPQDNSTPIKHVKKKEKEYPDPTPKWAPLKDLLPKELSSDLATVPKFEALVTKKCIVCHDGNSKTGNGQEGSQFPPFTSKWSQWKDMLRDPSSKTHSQAKDWLKRFINHVAHGSMLQNVNLDPNVGSGKEIAHFLVDQGKRHLETPPTNDGGNKLGSKEMISKVDPNKLPEYFEVIRNMNINNPEMRDLLKNFDIIYDKTGAPAWSWAPPRNPRDPSQPKGQRPVNREPSIHPRDEIFENSNGKWQWKEPFQDGFAIDSSTKGLKKFFLIKFPRDEKGNIIKGVVGTEDRMAGLAADKDSLWGSFPKGTLVAEVLYSTKLGTPIAVDLLTRKKVIQDNGVATWAPDAHRQDANPQAILAWIRKQPDYGTNKDLSRIEQAVRNPVADSVVSRLGKGVANSFIVDGKRTNSIKGSKSVLPPGINPSLLRRLYKEIPMTSALGSRGWQLESQDLFQNSHRGIAVNSKTCANCHNMASESFRDIFHDSKIPSHLVALYGNLGGYDGVLSAMWHSKEALSKFGKEEIWKMDSDWARFFENYNGQKHKPNMYRRMEHMDINFGKKHPLRNLLDARK